MVSTLKAIRSILPSPNSIVAFESAARTGNFTVAARELNVTQAAVSRHIRKLEDHLGFEVFRRFGGRVELTAEGARLSRAVTTGLGHITSAVREISEQSRKPRLTIGTTLSFANFWLVPRLAAFQKEYPDMELRLVTTDTDLDLVKEGIDLAIKFGQGRWPDLRAHLLFKPSVMPVCSPALLGSRGSVRSLQDLTRLVLLDRENSGTFGITWEDWLKAANTGPATVDRRICFSNYNVMIAAAIAGQGVALGWDLLVKDLISRRLLVCPFNRKIRPGTSYFLVSPRSSSESPSCAVFRAWITAQAGLRRKAVG